jgi:hypothetical protein
MNSPQKFYVPDCKQFFAPALAEWGIQLLSAHWPAYVRKSPYTIHQIGR